MNWIIIILIIVAVVLAAALIWTAMKRKKDQVARQRASELRSEAAETAASKAEQEARAREAQAEADRVRAEADKLEVRAHEERTSYDMTRAQQENAVREADRLDPDVDHRSEEYQPDLNGTPARRGEANGRGAHAQTQASTQGQGTYQGAHQEGVEHRSTGTANPVPPGPETIVPGEHDEPRRDQV
jgi:FtsZ-interacting cell division protein ZipA